jgi:hypothetical protein
MLEAGPVLWNNVLELHAKRPFHCMIGGGDQIYNDGVRVWQSLTFSSVLEDLLAIFRSMVH